MLFDDLIERRWGTIISAPPTPVSCKINGDFVPDGDDDNTPRPILDMDDPVDANNNAIDIQPIYDQLIHVELQLRHRNNMELAKVIGKSIGHDGKAAGTYTSQPHINYIIYDVEFIMEK